MSDNKYDEGAVILVVIVMACMGLAGGLGVGSVGQQAQLDHAWDEHATEQCYPYALYKAKLEDFSWMCSNENEAMLERYIERTLDTGTEPR